MSLIKPSYGDRGMAAFEPGIEFGGAEELFSGASPAYGGFEDFAVPAGMTLKAFEPVTVSGGVIAKAVAGTPATGITTAPVAASASVQRVAVAQAGCFNPAALAFGASYDTLEKKLNAFRGADTPTNVTVRARL